LIFAFAGIEAALVPGGEVKQPAQTVPQALFIGMGVITLLYAGLQLVAQGVLGPALATSKATPLADAAGVALGGWARQLLLIGAVIAMLGHAGAMILATPRMLFAFARDGFLPPALARLHPVHRSPAAAILL
jgi:basic amino acid/polyamine antiporter, APA family